MKKTIKLYAILIIVIAGACLVAYYLWQSLHKPKTSFIKGKKIEKQIPGEIVDLKYSLDGGSIYYVEHYTDYMKVYEEGSEDLGQGEFDRLCISDAKFNRQILLNGFHSGYLHLSPDGQYLAFFSDAGIDSTKLSIMNTKTAKLNNLVIENSASYEIEIGGWLPNGKDIWVITGHDVLIINLKSHKKKKILDHRYTPLAFLRGGKTMIFTSGNRLYSYNLKSHKKILIAEEEYGSFKCVLIDKKQDNIIYAVDIPKIKKTQIISFNLKSQKKKVLWSKQEKRPPYNNKMYFSKDEKSIIFSLSNLQKPSSLTNGIYVLGIESKRLKQITKGTFINSYDDYDSYDRNSWDYNAEINKIVFSKKSREDFPIEKNKTKTFIEKKVDF